MRLRSPSSIPARGLSGGRTAKNGVSGRGAPQPRRVEESAARRDALRPIPHALERDPEEAPFAHRLKIAQRASVLPGGGPLSLDDEVHASCALPKRRAIGAAEVRL